MSVFILEYTLSRTHVLRPNQSLPPAHAPSVCVPPAGPEDQAGGAAGDERNRTSGGLRTSALRERRALTGSVRACVRVYTCDWLLCTAQAVGVSPLHIAAHIGNEAACQWLLEQGKLRVHAVDKVGAPPTQPHLQWDTPLHLHPLSFSSDRPRCTTLPQRDIVIPSRGCGSTMGMSSFAARWAHATPTCRPV